MRFHKLRILWSVMCGIACVLLVALLMRSFWRCDGIYRLYKNGMQLTIASNEGIFLVPKHRSNSFDHLTPTGWKLRSQHPFRAFPYQWIGTSNESMFVIPHWFPFLLSATLAAAPWLQLHWHFSLRTLFIATTLVAVVLGAIVLSTGR